MGEQSVPFNQPILGGHSIKLTVIYLCLSTLSSRHLCSFVFDEMSRIRALRLSLEEEIVEPDVIVRRPRWFRERVNDFDNLDDVDFVTRYRLSKPTVLSVLEEVERHLEYRSDVNNSVAPINQLLCTLRYYATGSFQSVVADLGGFSQPTAHRIVHRVSAAIAALHRRYIHFPETPEEIKKAQLEFYEKAHFPLVIGAVDCTHIKLGQSPGGQNAEVFRNRKGFFSLNVQAICNANMEFIDIVARYPGSAHDSRIFRQSRRRRLFEEGVYGDALLVGDSGYGSRRYMMIPLDSCRTNAEQLYNESQIRTRNPVEKMYGIWKRRFPALALGLRVALPRTYAIISATAVLHNIARRNGEILPNRMEIDMPTPWEELLAQDDIAPLPEADHANRRVTVHNARREEIIATVFGRYAALQHRVQQ